MTPSRREFLQAAAQAAGALLSACSHAPGTPAPEPGTAVDVSSLVADGDSTVAPEKGPDGAPILVVRESAMQFHALSLSCTHEGCPVNPPVKGILTCPCHGSRFDLGGNVVRGPADFPLGRYETRYSPESHRLTVSFLAAK